MTDQRIRQLKQYLRSEIDRVEGELSGLRSSRIIYHTGHLEAAITAYENSLKKLIELYPELK